MPPYELKHNKEKFQKNTRSDIKIQKYSNIQVLNYRSIQVFKYSSIQVLKYSSIQVFKYSSIQVFNFTFFKFVSSTKWLLTYNVKARDPVGSKNYIYEIKSTTCRT